MNLREICFCKEKAKLNICNIFTQSSLFHHHSELVLQTNKSPNLVTQYPSWHVIQLCPPLTYETWHFKCSMEMSSSGYSQAFKNYLNTSGIHLCDFQYNNPTSWVDMCVCMYKENFNLVDWFMALHFMVTGTPLAATYIWILLMNKYVWWLIIFRMKGRY
jgi:hypothetical protein